MGLNPEFAIENGIRRQIRTHLRQKKVLTYSRVCSHFFLPNLHPSLSSRCFVSIAKSGLIKKKRGQRNRQRASRIKINIRNLQKKIRINPAAADKIKKAVLETCVSEKEIRNHEITICLVNDTRIKELNLLYMGKCVPTDVLSFDITMPNSRYAKTIFADIVVSTDTAINNAKVFQTTPSYELLLYVIHGVLHILGYDDISPGEKQLMQDKAESILRKVIY